MNIYIVLLTETYANSVCFDMGNSEILEFPCQKYTMSFFTYMLKEAGILSNNRLAYEKGWGRWTMKESGTTRNLKLKSNGRQRNVWLGVWTSYIYHYACSNDGTFEIQGILGILKHLPWIVVSLLLDFHS